MNKLLGLLAILGLGMSMSANAVKPFEVPLTKRDGGKTTLEALRDGKPLYIKFWATWCQDCMKQMPHFQEIEATYGDEIEVVGVNVWLNDSKENINKVIDKYGLTFPIVLDEKAELADSVNFVGTPYHLLFDGKGRLVHKGYEASPQLDEKLAVLAKGTLNLNDEKHNERIESSTLLTSQTGLNFTLFTAAWCDWYLEETRPEMSKNCIAAQNFLNNQEKMSDSEWQLVATRLWTGEKDLNAFVQKYSVDVDAKIDTSNTTFLHYQINKFPTLLVTKDGKEIGRIEDFSHSKNAKKKLDKIVNL